MTQNETLLTHLRTHGSISPMEANHLYRVAHLARRIKDLKEAGQDITTELKQDPTGRRYARYYLGRAA